MCQKPGLDGMTHPKCRTAISPDRLTAIFGYHTYPISRLILSGKYNFIPEIYRELGAVLAGLINIPVGTQLSCIPLSARKLRWRGFNQSMIIADAIANQTGIEVAFLLTRPRHTRAQKDLNKTDREKNMRNAFKAAPFEAAPLSVILVDDVTTTGSTFREASKVLKQAGVRYIWCIALAQD
jgi:competence protein ComFC